jgi:hypothetical protein
MSNITCKIMCETVSNRDFDPETGGPFTEAQDHGKGKGHEGSDGVCVCVCVCGEYVLMVLIFVD